MQEDGEIKRKYRSDLSLIDGEIDRLSHSVGQLLKFSRPAVAGQSSLDLAPVLGKIRQMFQAESERRQVELKITPGFKAIAGAGYRRDLPGDISEPGGECPGGGSGRQPNHHGLCHPGGGQR